MPEVPHYSFKYTLSTECEVRGSWTQEIVNYLDKHTLWYALVAELGENLKTHLHFACVFEIQDNNVSASKGAKTISNFKRQILGMCPNLALYLSDHPSKYAVSVQTLKSDEWIASYLQKEEELKYFRLPKDLAELQPYFADLQKTKPKNPEYDNWRDMYESEGRPSPATFESVWIFFNEHMYLPGLTPLKIMTDNKKLKERTNGLLHYLNGTIPQLIGNKRSSSDAGSSVFDSRVCPRCIEADYDVPNLLGPREQYCIRCKKY